MEPGPYVDLGDDGVICGEDTVQLDAGNAGASYLWNDGSSDRTLAISQDGTYSVTVTESGCTHSDTIQVDLEPFPSADFSAGTNPQGANIIDFTNQSSGSTNYTWWFGDGYFSTQNSPTHFYNDPGSYEVILVASNDCGTDTMRQTIEVWPTGIDGWANTWDVNVAPNPATDQVQLTMTHTQAGESVQARLFDLQGRLVWQSVIELSGQKVQTTIPLRGLANGLYQLQLIHGSATLQRTIVKQ